MAAAEWLAAKSRSYWDDAATLERDAGIYWERAASGAVSEDLSPRQWAIVYRAVAQELGKCANDVAS